MIEDNKWNELLNKVSVKKGDFFFVPSGTIHAIGEGILILETQQNSDTTYRVYDYNRLDDNGNKRELHVQQSVAVTTIPHQMQELDIVVEQKEGLTITTFVECEYFTVQKWSIYGTSSYTQVKPFLLCSVIEGDGALKTSTSEFTFKKGDHFLLPNEFGEFELSGDSEIIVSYL